MNTVDSQYLEVQGIVWNISKYPYLDIIIRFDVLRKEKRTHTYTQKKSQMNM